MDLMQDLICVLETENRLLQELIGLGSKKRENINDAKVVADCAAQEQGVLVELEKTDGERRLLFDALGLAADPANWRLNAEAARQAELASLIAELAENLAALQALNHVNQQLLAESLAYVQFSLNVLVGDDNQATYAPTGASSQVKTIFDRKV
ncbi:MAG TPA: flagellar protein FlgN [Firmicutes bacterium]|nr:flagellar protein FlgN [Bacillota bacterium]